MADRLVGVTVLPEFLQVEGYKYSLEQKGVKAEQITRLAIEFERGIVAKRRW